MKKVIFAIACLALPAIFFSCEQKDIDLYDGEAAIFFDQQNRGHISEAWIPAQRLGHQNYSLVNFSTMETSDTIVNIKIETTGYVTEYDRPFTIEIVDDSTSAIEGEEFEILERNLVIPAKGNMTYVQVAVHKTNRMYQDTVMLQMRINPGEHFVLPFGDKGIGKMPLRDQDVDNGYGTNTDPSVHDVFMTSVLTKPGTWPLYTHTTTWGTYSSKKYGIILDLCGAKYGWTAATFEKMNQLPRQRAVARILSEYLNEHNQKQATSVVEDNGFLMWCHGCTYGDSTVAATYAFPGDK